MTTLLSCGSREQGRGFGQSRIANNWYWEFHKYFELAEGICRVGDSRNSQTDGDDLFRNGRQTQQSTEVENKPQVPYTLERRKCQPRARLSVRPYFVA
jgi:hypothetical protein